MDTYFCFSDECGDYQPGMSVKQIEKHPFYVRSTLLMNASSWKTFNGEFKKLKLEHELNLENEIKWADVWKLRHFQKNGKEIPNNHRLKPLEHFDYHLLIEFVEKSLTLIGNLNEKKIILTYSFNRSTNRTTEQRLLEMHLQEHMQRIEMELQVEEDNLGVLFFDPVSQKKNEQFRNIYNKLFQKGDYIEQYSHIKDSLNFENSHHSVGIQVTDYISGAFSALLRSHGNNIFDRGVKMYFAFVEPYLRQHNGNVHGYGIREVPKNDSVRKRLIKHIEEKRNGG